MALGSKKRGQGGEAISPSAEELLRRADRFLSKLAAKMEIAAGVVRKKDLERVDVVSAELKVYASHTEGRLDLPSKILEPQASEMRASLDQFISQFTRAKISSDVDAQVLLRDAQTLLGTISASRELNYRTRRRCGSSNFITRYDSSGNRAVCCESDQRSFLYCLRRSSAMLGSVEQPQTSFFPSLEIISMARHKLPRSGPIPIWIWLENFRTSDDDDGA
jgi:hypothetical protein